MSARTVVHTTYPNGATSEHTIAADHERAVDLYAMDFDWYASECPTQPYRAVTDSVDSDAPRSLYQ